MTGWDILGCGTVDGLCEWPEPVPRMDNGKMGTRMTPAGSAIFGLVEQELEIWKWFLDHEEYDSVCVVEADNLFVRKPDWKPNGDYLITELPNRALPGLFRTPSYFSTPRWACRDVAASLYLYGMMMFKHGEVEWFMSDRFPALICYEHEIPFRAQPAWSPSVDAVSDEIWLREARTAVGNGVYCLHSVKHEWQLDKLRDLLPVLATDEHR